MMMTQQQRSLVKKPADREATVTKRDDDRAKEPVRRSTPVERLDWRGEGVVGDNHTD